MNTGRLSITGAVALGGMIGATCRYAIAEWLPNRAGAFPWATFWTNVSGGFMLGLLLAILLDRFPPTRYVRPFFASGVLGAFTTMSTFQVEAAVLVKDGHAVIATIYALASLAVGLVACYLGIGLGRRSST